MPTIRKIDHTMLHGVVLWALALGLVAGGFYLSEIRFLDQEWLARAGCLIVILGIWSGLGGVIQRKLLHKALTIKKNINERHIRRAFGADEHLMENELHNLNEDYLARLARLQNELGVSIGVIEASLLITGTLLWGFGDLIKYI